MKIILTMCLLAVGAWSESTVKESKPKTMSKTEDIGKLLKNNPRIINGNQVSSANDKWRFIVSLRDSGDHYCGGSLIAPNWVLTAAHCLNGYAAAPKDTVATGSYNLPSMTEIAAKRFIVHPLYDPATINNDIALIELNNPSNMAFIAHDTSHSLAEDTLTEVAGWGNMSTSGSDFPENLMEVLVPIVNHEECNTLYGGSITPNMICAGYVSGGKDSCQGDSGGPLIVNDKLVGIVSWGIGCAQENYPGVYTKVQKYGDWINNSKSYKVILSKSETVSEDEFKYYKIDASKSQAIVASLKNISADLDLYVKAGSKPTDSSYDCRPYKGGTIFEACSIESDLDIYIGVHGYRAGSYDLEVIRLGAKKFFPMPSGNDGLHTVVPY